MTRFTVWSPHDGQPVPARNARERDALIGRGFLAERPTIGEQGPENWDPSRSLDENPKAVPGKEAADAGETAGANSGDLPADNKRGRVRGRPPQVAAGLAGDAEPDGEVPPATQ